MEPTVQELLKLQTETLKAFDGWLAEVAALDKRMRRDLCEETMPRYRAFNEDTTKQITDVKNFLQKTGAAVLWMKRPQELKESLQSMLDSLKANTASLLEAAKPKDHAERVPV